MAHRAAPVDLFFSYFYSAYVDPQAIESIGERGITTVNWYCNASYQFRLVSEIAPAYHYSLVPERFRLDDYREIGATPIYCQEAANPDSYHPYDLPEEFDVTFVGQRYGDRPELIRALWEEGVDVRAWGPRWLEEDERSYWRRSVEEFKRVAARRPSNRVPVTQLGGPLSDDEYVRMYSKSRISLGFTKVAEAQSDGSVLKQVRLRDFEAPMSGAFYLVEQCDELLDFFEADREVVTFNDRAELIEKATWYLEHPEMRERIRNAGRRRALAEHTWQARFVKVFREIGLES